MKKTIVLLLTLITILSLAACGSSVTTSSAEPDDSGSSAETEVESADFAEYEETRIEITNAEFTDDYKDVEDGEGVPAIMVSFKFANSGSDPLYALESFGIFAYQDGVELEYISLNDDVHKEGRNVAVGVKDGAEIDCMMAFATTSDSPVELRISEPTADAKLLIKKIYEK